MWYVFMNDWRCQSLVGNQQNFINTELVESIHSKRSAMNRSCSLEWDHGSLLGPGANNILAVTKCFASLKKHWLFYSAVDLQRLAQISTKNQNIIERKKNGTSLDARRDPVVPRDIPRQGPRTTCKMFENIHFRTFINIFKCFKYSYFKIDLHKDLAKGQGWCTRSLCV